MCTLVQMCICRREWATGSTGAGGPQKAGPPTTSGPAGDVAASPCLPVGGAGPRRRRCGGREHSYLHAHGRLEFRAR